MANYKPNVETLPLPIVKGTYRNVDNEALSDRNFQLYDGYLNELGYHSKRPCLSNFGDLGLGTNYPVVGMFWWSHQNYALAVANGKVFKVEYSGGVAVITDLAGTALTNGIPAIFATDGTSVFVAAGGPILYTNGTAAMAAITDGDAPTTVTHVDWLDGYLLAINGTNKFFYSVVNDAQDWSALAFFSATGNADNIVAMKVFQREIYLFGSTTTEIWENAGEYPQVFRRVDGGFHEIGCIAPYSVINSEEGTYWLSDERRVTRLAQGGKPERISTPYDREIDEMSAVSDCIGNHLEIDGQPFLVFNFASASRSLVYNLASKTWSEWSYYNTATASYERFLGDHFCYAPTWGKNLAGSRLSSMIYTLSRMSTTDLGVQVRGPALTTGHIDHGTLKQKKCHELRMRVKCGPRDTTTTPVLMVRWRNNNKDWSSWHEISLGDVGETWIVKRLKRLGIYQTRQWEFVLTEPMQFSFGGVEEDVEILR